MDQAVIATSSSWKLLPWPLLGGSSKKPCPEKPPKKVSALKRRLQAHAAIARSLSPFCARTSFDSAPAADEENKCLLSLSAFMHACSRCTSSALRDVHVPVAVFHSPHQQKAYMNAIHHHLLYAHHLNQSPSLRRPQNRACNGDASHTKEVQTSIQHRDDYVKKISPSRRGDIMTIESSEYDENGVRPYMQEKHQRKMHKQGEPSTRGGIDVAQKQANESKHRHSYHKQKDPSIKPTENSSDEHAHHSTSSSKKYRPPRSKDARSEENVEHAHLKPTLSSSKESVELETPHKKSSYVKRRATPIPQLDADLYICTTAHVLGQHKDKMKAFEEDMHHYHKHQPWGEMMHQHSNQDPPLLKDTQHKYAIKDSNPVRKSKGKGLQERESFMETHHYPRNTSTLKESIHYMHPSKSFSLSYKPLKAYQANSDPPLAKASESFCANKDISLKANPLHAYSKQQKQATEIQGSVGGSSRARHDHEIKVTHTKPDNCNLSGGIWLQDTFPVVKYSYDPYVDFHNSMLDMLLGRGLKDLHELQDMFVCYVLLNSPCNQQHIEKAFKDLLTDLYRCKMVVSLQTQ